MAVPHVEAQYLSAGANRFTAVADWNEDGVIAYGSDRNIALWRPGSAQGVTQILTGHQDVVKAVKFLTGSYLISGADDQCVKLWQLGAEGKPKCLSTAHEHKAAINCIATLHEQRNRQSRLPLFATGAADSTVKIWRLGDDGREMRVLQTIKPSPKLFPLAVSLSRLGDGEAVALAVAGTKDLIQVFVAESATAPEFRLQATLAGHEGWIRSLDFTWEPYSQDLILASASQDKYIRLWRFHPGRELPAAAADGADPSMSAFLPGKSPSNKVHRLEAAAGEEYSITFEALLLGHDDWIYSARWFSDPRNNGRLNLLSASADNTLAIWEADISSGIWTTTTRLGEISREKGATTATGSTGGFWTGLWSPDGSSVACIGRTGSWRLWDHGDGIDGEWVPNIGLSGHTKAVTGIAWAKNGEYLLSTSSDQTTRLHAAWSRNGTTPEDSANGHDKQITSRPSVTWHEMARPQIHGYDLNCIDSLGATQFVSGADEKLMRVFDEPKAVARLLHRLCGIGGSDGGAPGVQDTYMPDAANMPVLGLSNKAVDLETEDTSTADAGSGQDLPTATTTIDRPPLEDALSRHMLWPEAEKLYGHGYELSCLAASHDGRLVASACRASSVNHAVIRIFETGPRWTECVRPPLAAHSLTATRLRFSLDDRWLLSVGRDRMWAVFERETIPGGEGGEGEGEGPRLGLGFSTVQTNPKGHSRMILDAAWAPQPTVATTTTPSAAPPAFATAGRDKQVKIWRSSAAADQSGDGATISQSITCVTTIPESHPVTAVDFLPHTITTPKASQQTTPPGEEGQKDTTETTETAEALLLAVGTEAGKITIYTIDSSSLSVLSSMVLQPELCLAKSVLQLSWRPSQRGVDDDHRQHSQELAIAGDDGSLRIYSFDSPGA